MPRPPRAEYSTAERAFELEMSLLHFDYSKRQTGSLFIIPSYSAWLSIPPSMYPWVRRINGTRAGPPGPYSHAKFAAFALRVSRETESEIIIIILNKLITFILPNL
jgi:hypothetical protein